jgi:hypothetical protein
MRPMHQTTVNMTMNEEFLKTFLMTTKYGA